jgi:hypothetical protein
VIKNVLPTYENDGFILNNGYEIHLEHPDTFWVPDELIRKNIQRGWHVKLIYNIEVIDPETKEKTYEVERMWTLVGGKEREYYFGYLDNDPYCTEDLRAGKKVYFTHEYIIDFIVPEKDKEEKFILALKEYEDAQEI